MQYWGIGTIVFLLPYLILVCILQTLSVPLIPAIGIRILAFIGCTAVAGVRGTRLDCYTPYSGILTWVHPSTFIFIAALFGAPIFIHLAALGVETVAISVLGVAALSWVAVLTSIRLEEFTLFILFIGTLPAQITFAAMIFSDQHPALAMLSATVVGILTIGFLCRWICGEELWSSPDYRGVAAYAAWGDAGIWAVVCAWTLTFAEMPPDGLNGTWLFVLALSAATIKLMLSEAIDLPFSLLGLFKLALTVSLIDVGLGWLIRFHFT